MSTLMIKDLNESKSLDQAAMSSVRGGLTIGAMTFDAAQSQTIGGSGYNVGNVNAVNTPVFAPTNNIVENNPATLTTVNLANLTNVMNSGVQFS